MSIVLHGNRVAEGGEETQRQDVTSADIHGTAAC
jgi:hypothetical protein